MNTKKRILVTGGKGLVGSAIEAVSLEYQNIDFLFSNKDEFDLTNENDVKKLFKLFRPTHVIHTAAFVGGIGRNLANPAGQYYKNILINSFVTHYSYLNGIKNLVSFSSVCAFPENVKIMNENEIHNGSPHKSYFSYAYSKRLVDVQNSAYNKEYGTKYITLIPGNIYGKRDNFNLEFGHVVPSLIHKCFLAKQKQSNFNIWGDGSVFREFIYSEDIAKIAIELVLNELEIPTCIIASGNEELRIKDVVKYICDAFDYHKINWQKEKPNGQFRRQTEKKIFESIFPEFNFTSFESGIEKTVNWFNLNYPNIRK